jgi:serine/threonine protein kinase
VPQIDGCRIGELLGEGATGAVYAATDSQGRQLAIKFLHEALAGDTEAIARFTREGQNCARIRSDYVASIVGAGQSDDTYWIAYERLAGETLATRLRRERALAPEAAARCTTRATA